MFGNGFVEIIWVGVSYDEAFHAAICNCRLDNMLFIYPFDDLKMMEGLGTIGLDIFEEMQVLIDFIFVPTGGGFNVLFFLASFGYVFHFSPLI